MLERLASFLPGRQYELFIAKRYQRQMDRARKAFLKSERWQQIRSCNHLDRRANPEATSIQPPHLAEICNTCGIGIVTRHG